jgi:hypothetical protein
MNFEDPRVQEFRAAGKAVELGLSGSPDARERYRRAIVPYVEFMAENTPEQEHVRVAMIEALVRDGLPLGVVAGIYRATKDELAKVRDEPPIQPEVQSQEDWLRSLSYGAYLRSEHWKSVRAAALERAGHRCQLCNSPDRLEVHHRTYERRGRERPTDVTVLCDECHARHHGKRRVA